MIARWFHVNRLVRPLWPLMLLFQLTWISFVPKYADAAISCICTSDSCNPDKICEDNYRIGSVCDTEKQICTNPFAGGCLRAMLNDNDVSKGAAQKWDQLRTCNSDDPPHASELGLCVQSEFKYSEVRIHHGNWESSMLYAWVIQIFLSEVLSVPVTVGLETNKTGASSFYNLENTFSYSSSAYPFEALKEAKRVGDCRKTDQECCHVFPEGTVDLVLYSCSLLLQVLSVSLTLFMLSINTKIKSHPLSSVEWTERSMVGVTS